MKPYRGAMIGLLLASVFLLGGRYYAQRQEAKFRKRTEHMLNVYFPKRHEIPPVQPQFSDYNRASDETMQRLQGRWEIIQSWQGRWCVVSKDRDRRRNEFDRQLVDINENLVAVLEQRVWDGDLDIKCRTHIAFDEYQKGTFLRVSYTPSGDDINSNAEKVWAKSNAARWISEQINDRGIYRFEGDRLLLYWVDLTKEGKALPTPPEIPEPPLIKGSNLLILRRIDPAQEYPPSNEALEIARQEHLLNEAFMKERGPNMPDKLVPTEMGQLKSLQPGTEAWRVEDPQKFPQDIYQLYEDLYGKP